MRTTEKAGKLSKTRPTDGDFSIREKQCKRIQVGNTWMQRRLSTEELMLLNYSAGEDFESPLETKEIEPVNPKGNQPWTFTGRTDTEAEAPILWPPDVKSWLTGKDPDAGKDGRQEERGMTKDEMVEWHHWLDGQEFQQALGEGEGQGSLACCIHGVAKSQDATEWVKNNNGHVILLKVVPRSLPSCFTHSVVTTVLKLNSITEREKYLQ